MINSNEIDALELNAAEHETADIINMSHDELNRFIETNYGDSKEFEALAGSIFKEAMSDARNRRMEKLIDTCEMGTVIDIRDWLPTREGISVHETKYRSPFRAVAAALVIAFISLGLFDVYQYEKQHHFSDDQQFGRAFITAAASGNLWFTSSKGPNENVRNVSAFRVEDQNASDAMSFTVQSLEGMPAPFASPKISTASSKNNTAAKIPTIFDPSRQATEITGLGLEAAAVRWGVLAYSADDSLRR